MPRSGPLFTPDSSRAVHLDVRAVDGQRIGRSRLGDQRREDTREHALLAPSRITIVDRLGRPVFRQTVRPMKAAFDDVNDAAQNTPIIDTRHAAYLVRQQGLDLLERLFAQPEQVAHGRSP
jgi:hypothetical protein